MGQKPTTADYYKLLSDRGTRWSPHRWVWLRTIPHRHKFFLWLAFRGRLNTKENMTKKEWRQDAGCDICPTMETIAHIALHCRHSHWLWDKWTITSIADSSSCIAEFVDTVQSELQGKSAEAWPVCFAAGLWNQWKRRNDRVFNGKQSSRRILLQQVAEDIRLWAVRTPRLQNELRLWADKLSD